MMFIDLVIFAVGHCWLPTDRKREQVLMNMKFIRSSILSFPERLLGCTERPTSQYQRHSLSSFAGTNQFDQ